MPGPTRYRGGDGLTNSRRRESRMRALTSTSLVLILLAAALLEGAPAPSPGGVDIRGEVTRIGRAERGGRDGVVGLVLIEGAKESDTQVDKASVTVRRETELYIRRGGGRGSPAEFAALREGQKVEARFTGPVLESYPVQATAAEITIIEE